VCCSRSIFFEIKYGVAKTLLCSKRWHLFQAERLICAQGIRAHVARNQRVTVGIGARSAERFNRAAGAADILNHKTLAEMARNVCALTLSAMVIERPDKVAVKAACGANPKGT
jgi:hypothetical protein